MIHSHHDVIVAEIWESLWRQTQITQLLDELKCGPTGNPRVIQSKIEEDGGIFSSLKVLIW